MQTHVSYKTAKLLKEFLGGIMPMPLGDKWWGRPIDWDGGPVLTTKDGRTGIEWLPAYQLHDIFSKPFCEAMGNTLECALQERINLRKDVATRLFYAYFEGGLPFIEKALLGMMEGK